MNYKIGLLYGDGIGPEITTATERMMKAAVNKFDIEMEFPVFPMGWEGIKKIWGSGSRDHQKRFKGL